MVLRPVWKRIMWGAYPYLENGCGAVKSTTVIILGECGKKKETKMSAFDQGRPSLV